MKKLIQWSLFIVLFGTITPAFSQLEWSPAQKEVWKTETTITDLFMKGDFQAAYAYYDESYMGWNNSMPAPMPKSSMMKEIAYEVSLGGKFDYYNAVPVVIWVNGNYAYADYYYSAVFSDKDGKKMNEHGRWLDVLMKKDGKWLLVGDHGGSDPSPTK